MHQLSFAPISEIKRIRKSISDPFALARIFADIARLNALYMIMRAGSGHIGSSFSSLDIVTWLWTREMGKNDVYFSSKGHDAPGLYSLLIGLEKLDFNYIHKLRRIGGLPGHPDVDTPCIVTNSGPLGMGISKARGMAIANRLNKKKSHIYVLVGDGELEEGQIWESLQPTANGKFSEITVIVDANKIQSDTWVQKVSDLGKLEEKFRAFGWAVARCDGHDFPALKKNLARFKKIKDRPQILIADTIKGKGVSFMERVGEDGFYKFHSGAPTIEVYSAALKELLEKINTNLLKSGKGSLRLQSLDLPPRITSQNVQRLVAAYGDELVKIARKRKDVVVLDADLILDTGLIPFNKEFPNRLVECGIAEQDMVSAAGGLALKGMLPIVHSFACFLSARPNEQIYNNATEKKKIIYVGSLAGLLPAPPGHSHQSVRDISAIGGIPGLTLVQPCNEQETRLALRWAVEKNKKSAYIRLISIPVEPNYKLPPDYELKEGKGTFLRKGNDAVLIAYGPVMLTEAIKTAEILSQEKISLAVMNFPWLNKIDRAWLLKALKPYKKIFTLDDHYVTMGQGAMIAAVVSGIVSFGVEEIPACGQNSEVLRYHGLDAQSIAKKIKHELQ